MNTRIAAFIALLIFALFHLAEAQQPTKIPRIGYLGLISPSASSARIEAFRQGLRELGYVEGKYLDIRYARDPKDIETAFRAAQARGGLRQAL